MKFKWFRKQLSFDDNSNDTSRNEFHDSSIILSRGVYRQSIEEEPGEFDGVQLRRDVNRVTPNTAKKKSKSGKIFKTICENNKQRLKISTKTIKIV